MWGIEFDLILVLGSKVTCFLYGGSNFAVCGPTLTCWERDGLFIWFLCGCWSKFTWFMDAGRRSLRLVLVGASRLTWFLYGWSILSWFQCVGSNLTWFQFRNRNCLVLFLWGRKRFGFSIWIGIDLDFLWWCSTANRYGVLTYRCVGYVLEDWSFNVDWVLSSSVVYPF